MPERSMVKRVSFPSILPFFLPKIELDDDLLKYSDPGLELEYRGLLEDFSLTHLAWAIQKQVDPQRIRTYLDQYGASETRSALCKWIPIFDNGVKYPILFFAAEANSPEFVRMLCKAGADPKLRCISFASRSCLTVLSYTVLSAEYTLSDTTDTVLALLAMGACPSQVPSDLWYDYLAVPKRDSPNEYENYFVGKDDGDPEWCTTEVRHALCRTLNLMQRYALWKAGKTLRPTSRQLQLAGAWGMLPLFEVPFHIIGQQQSTQLLQKSILSHRLYPTRLRPWTQS